MHRPAFNDFSGVVVPKRKRVFGLWTFELDFIDFWKIRGHAVLSFQIFDTAAGNSYLTEFGGKIFQKHGLRRLSRRQEMASLAVCESD